MDKDIVNISSTIVGTCGEDDVISRRVTIGGWYSSKQA